MKSTLRAEVRTASGLTPGIAAALLSSGPVLAPTGHLEDLLHETSPHTLRWHLGLRPRVEPSLFLGSEARLPQAVVRNFSSLGTVQGSVSALAEI